MKFQARSALIAVFVFLSLLFLLRPSFLQSNSNSDLKNLRGVQHQRDGTVPRIAKVSMLYGSEVNPYYVRALKSHRRHNERWNYGMHILEQDMIGGYWNKPSYLLSLVVAELAKPPPERVEWLMWVDADLILVNHAVPLETFLPPPDFPNIKFLGSRDGPGLNSGTFFLKVSPWAVQMLAKSIGLPMFRPDVDLGYSIDQSAMAYILNETEFHASGETVFQPRTWYNDFQFHEEIGTEWVEGDLLIHFPGLEEDRWLLMDKWLNKVERSPDSLLVDLEKTRYPGEIKDFWDMLRHSIDLVNRAQTYIDEGRVNLEAVAEAAFKVQQLIWDTKVFTPPGTDLMQLYKDATAELEKLLDRHASST
ncbi:MAG: hypothetical protein Q9162_002770 [Coniocarpon cinnabarinum]